jgi:hypothetical protein
VRKATTAVCSNRNQSELAHTHLVVDACDLLCNLAKARHTTECVQADKLEAVPRLSYSIVRSKLSI